MDYLKKKLHKFDQISKTIKIDRYYWIGQLITIFLLIFSITIWFDRHIGNNTISESTITIIHIIANGLAVSILTIRMWQASSRVEPHNVHKRDTYAYYNNGPSLTNLGPS